MKSQRSSQIAAVTVLVALGLLALVTLPVLAQGGGTGTGGSWTAEDGHTTTLVANHNGGGNYRVSSNGPDDWVTVQVFDSGGALIATVELQENTSVDVGVSDGGSIKVDNPETGAGGQFAAGHYQSI